MYAAYAAAAAAEFLTYSQQYSQLRYWQWQVSCSAAAAAV